jgi:hypothetical protein
MNANNAKYISNVQRAGRHWFRVMACAPEQDFWTLRLEKVMILSRGTSFSAEG